MAFKKFLLLLLAVSFVTQASAQSADVWDLTDLYPTPQAWMEAYQATDAVLDDMAALKGTLGESDEALATAMTLMSDIYREVARLYVYASTKTDEDQRVSENQERLSIARQLYSNFGESIAWMDPELLAVGEETIAKFQRENSDLDNFDFYFQNVLRNAEHTLTDEAEAVLAAAGLVLSSPTEIYSLLVNADVPWPTITLSTGEEVVLNQAAYSKHRAAPNREDRMLVFNTFWSTWQEYKDSLGMILGTEVNANVMQARVRHYDSTLAMQLAQENIPTGVYETLVAEVNAALPTLHRYFTLRGRMLGLEQMHYYDIYPPMIELDKTFDIETSRKNTLASLQPFGEEYIQLLELTLNSPWTHVYPAPGKRSGAYMAGSAYDVHPYVLLNHNDDFSSMSTYAHEYGHAVHSLLANAAQPFEKADYSIFTAEIASQINEILLEEYMIENAETPEEKLFYLGYSLESMRGSFFRQTMFAEFEASIHQAVENGEPLSGDRMNEIYGDLLKRYHGHDQGVLLIDDTYAVEWAYIPHFYYDFYVYQYATSIAGAAWFADRLLQGNPEEPENFIDTLKAGGSDYPYEILKDAGLDMASPAPYRAAVARMNDVMDRMEAILEELGR